MSNKYQLFAAIVLVSLFLLAASVLAVVLSHRSKTCMDSSEDVTEKLRVTTSFIQRQSDKDGHVAYCICYHALKQHRRSEIE